MRIVLTGSGSGGHFYPLIATAEAIRSIVREEKIIEPELYFFGPSVLDKDALIEYDITWVRVSAGKVRRYFAIRNISDLFKTAWGVMQALVRLYKLYPDVIFSKGGYASFPTTVAARILGIPVVIHDSDAHPGRANVIASRWAVAVATSFPGAINFFPKKAREKVILVGNPTRKTLFTPVHSGAHEYLKLDRGIPVLFILGGSQGAQAINSVVLSALPRLLDTYQIIHQTGPNNFTDVQSISRTILSQHPHKSRYHPYGFLNTLAMRMAAGVSTLIITRAGSGSIFEVAAWGIPAIVIPIPEDVSHDQTHNAFAYARTGAATVIKQENLTPNVLVAEIERIVQNPDIHASMSEAARGFAKPDAARKLARIIIDIGLTHEE